jgi:hypothetical protein
VIGSWRQLDRLTRVRLAFVAGAGCVAPWITGAGVKLYLDAHGQPTHPWSEFLNPVAFAILIPATLVWASPFIALALFAWWFQRRPAWPWLTATDRWLVVLGGLLVGLWKEVQLFVEVFWVWDPIALFAGPLLAMYCVPHIVAGMALGAVAAAVLHGAGPRAATPIRPS